MLVCRNIVCTVNLGCKLDLKKIALHARNAEYNPKRFAAVIMRIRDPRTTALIFSSGKMVCTGAKRFMLHLSLWYYITVVYFLILWVFTVTQSLGINKHTRRAFDAPVTSRRPHVSGGRSSHVEQSAGRCHFVAIAVDIQETAEDRTVCSELPIAPTASDTVFLLLTLLARPFVFVFFCFVRCSNSLWHYATLISFVH